MKMEAYKKVKERVKESLQKKTKEIERQTWRYEETTKRLTRKTHPTGGREAVW